MRFYKITDEMEAKARAYQDQVRASLKKKRKTRNYTNLNDPDQWLKGNLGEQGMMLFLKDVEIPYIYRTRANGIGDKSEFIIYERCWDVKTAGEAFHSKMMMPLSQFIKHPETNFYIGARLNRPWVEIWGYISRGDLAKCNPAQFGKHIDTMFCELNKLIDIDNLLDKSIFLR